MLSNFISICLLIACRDLMCLNFCSKSNAPWADLNFLKDSSMKLIASFSIAATSLFKICYSDVNCLLFMYEGAITGGRSYRNTNTFNCNRNPNTMYSLKFGANHTINFIRSQLVISIQSGQPFRGKGLSIIVSLHLLKASMTFFQLSCDFTEKGSKVRSARGLTRASTLFSTSSILLGSPVTAFSSGPKML